MWSGNSFSCSAGLLLSLCFLQIIAATDKQKCAPSSCGKITNISYPFRLKDESPASCGDPRYELLCENNVTVLPLFSGKYHVQAINYENYTIRLVDPAIQENDCSSIPRYFLYASNFSDPYNGMNYVDPYQYTQNRKPIFQHVIYMNCSNPVRDDPVYVDTAPCVNWHSKGYVYAIAGDLRVEKLKVDCHVKLVAPTSAFGPADYWEIPNQTFSYAEIHRMLVHGFDVSWISGPCEDLCGKSDCYLNGTTESLQCYDYRPSFCISPLGFPIRCG